jgi:hypothetical protein
MLRIVADGWTISFSILAHTVRECEKYVKSTYGSTAKIVSIGVNL